MKNTSPLRFKVYKFPIKYQAKKQKLAFSDQNTTNRLIIFISAKKYVSFSPLKSSKNLI